MTAFYAAGGAELVNGNGIPLVAIAPPTAGNILNGMASTDGGTILTVPANSTALISISVSASLTSASTTGTPSVTITGTGCTPATGSSLAALVLKTNAGQTLQNSTEVFNNIYLYSGSATATIKLNFGSSNAAVAIVNGSVLP